MKKMMIGGLLLLTLFPLLVAGQFGFGGGGDEIGWYDVSASERRICSQWGGTEEAQEVVTGSSPVVLSLTTIALQGKREIYRLGPDAPLDDAPQIYTVSFFFSPMEGEMKYELALVHGGLLKRVLENGTATSADEGAGYLVRNFSRAYETVRLTYGDDDKYLEVRLLRLFI